MRGGLAIAAIAAAAVLAQPPGRADVPDAERAAWAETCRGYEERAAAMPQDAGFSLPVLLAEACRGAIGSVAAGGPQERHAAARFLLRLTSFRDTIAQMTLRRAYAGQPPALPEGLGRVVSVSATGEYLIAREMGVLRALDQWLETGPPVSLAAR